MTDRAELMEAALDCRADGVALIGMDCEVVFWNRAAEAITGYAGVELISRGIPEALEPLLLDAGLNGEWAHGANAAAARGAVVEARHKQGHTFRAIARREILRDALGERIGAGVVFHPAESVDALPHGEAGESDAEGLEASQAELEEKLEIEFDDSARGGPALGVLWVSVDQAEELRKTHGAGACEAMLEKVRRALMQGLRPGEQVGRWGENEFLIVAHERSAEMLAAHGQTLAGLARTADFRWWGDRISIAVSVGAAQAGGAQEESLTQLLERARRAMETSRQAGGNRATLASGRAACLPS